MYWRALKEISVLPVGYAHVFRTVVVHHIMLIYNRMQLKSKGGDTCNSASYWKPTSRHTDVLACIKRDFTVLPVGYAHVVVHETINHAFAFPAEGGSHFTDPELT